MSEIYKGNDDTSQFEFKNEWVPMKYTWSTGTGATPSSRKIQFNNADYLLVTEIYINKHNEYFVEMKSVILGLDSGSNLLVGSIDKATTARLYSVTGPATLSIDTVTIPVAYVSGGSSSDLFESGEGVFITPFLNNTPGGSSEFGDDVFRVIDNGDNTKKIAFEASSITTATVRTVTMPDTDVDLGDIATNNVKVTNAIHTGDAIGATALTLATVNSDVGSYAKPTLTVNAKGLVTAVADGIIGGVTLSSSSNTNILNGTYVILADTTTVTSVTSGIDQDSNWTLEVTQAGITDQKGVITFTGNLEKDAGGGANYDVAIFKNGSIVSESEQVDQKLESDGKGQSVTVMAIIEFSTNDTFDIRVAGNGTANDIFCGGGSLYIQ